MLMKMMRV